MSLDELLAGALRRAADDGAEPDVEHALATVRDRSHTRRQRRRAVAGVAAAALAVVAVGALATGRGDRDPAATATTPPTGVPPTSATDPTAFARPTTTSAPAPTAAPLHLCAERYGFGYAPPGWERSGSATPELRGDGGSVRLVIAPVPTMPTVVDRFDVLGFAATERTDGNGTYEVRLDAGTDPSCNGELAVVGSGMTASDVAAVAKGIVPAYLDGPPAVVFPVGDTGQLLAELAARQLRVGSEAARAFASELGYDAPIVLRDISVSSGSSAREVTITGRAGEPDLLVGVDRLLGTGYWVVTYAGTATAEDRQPRVTIAITTDASVPDVVTTEANGAASVRLTIDDGGQHLDQTMPTAATTAASWTFELGPRRDYGGAVTIRWYEADGRLAGAFAEPIGGGDQLLG